MINILYLITDWKNNMTLIVLYSLNVRADFLFVKCYVFLPHSFIMIKFCREPPWQRGSVLDPRPPVFEFRTICLEGSAISFISPSSGGSIGQVYPMCEQRWPKTLFIFYSILSIVLSIQVSLQIIITNKR